MKEIEVNNTADEFWESLYIQDEGDLTIKLSDESTIRVISYVLKHKSTVFRDMLNAEMTEKMNSTIDMTTYNPLSVKYFFAYIYFNGVYRGNDIDIYFELVFLAKQYKIDEFYIELEGEILRLLNQETFRDILANCKKYGDICNEIYSKVIEYIHQHAFICYDKKKYAKYSWCCKHRYRCAINNYQYYTIDSKHACICYNLKTRVSGPKCIKFDSHFEGKPVPDDAYTERCCLHRKQIFNFDMLKDLDLSVKDDILKFLYTRDV